MRGNGDVDLAAAAVKRRQPRRHRRAGARGRHDDGLRQGLGCRQTSGRSSRRSSSPTLHARGLRVCAWQFVYGKDPLGEAAAGAATVAAGADCLIIDAETDYEGRYAAGAALRAARCARRSARRYPLGLTSFPYVDYHPGFPYSVFLAPGAAQANLPQVYWKDIGGSVDAVSAKTVAQNRIYGTPIAPLGQAYDASRGRRHAALPRDLGGLRRRRAVVVELAGRERRDVGRADAAARPRRSCRPIPAGPRCARAPRATRSSGCSSTWPRSTPALEVRPAGASRPRPTPRCERFQTARGLPPSGITDAATWLACSRCRCARSTGRRCPAVAAA